MKNFLLAARDLLKVLHDFRIYLLIIPAAIALTVIDSVLAKTWLEWGLVMFVIVGFALAMRKVVFNELDLSAAVGKACETSTGSAYVVLAVALFMAAVLVSATLWLAH